MARNALTQARTVAAARTTLTYPRTSLGGVYIPGAKSIEGATGDTARTTSGYIEGTATVDTKNLHWYAFQQATAYSHEFDTSVTRTGTKTLKISTTDTTGRTLGTSNRLDPPNMGEFMPIKANTSYTFNCYVKTNNVAANSVYCRVITANVAGYLTQNLTNKLSGTNDWTLLTKTFTSDATATHVGISCFNFVAGNISDAWFDVSGMTLVESGVTRNAVV